MSFIDRIRTIFSNNDPVQEPGKPTEGELMGNPEIRDAHDDQSRSQTDAPPPLDQKVRPESERNPGDTAV